jgi:hypothetical protein
VEEYWNDMTVSEVVALLIQYLDLFPYILKELKGLEGKLEEIKIELKPYAKPIKNRPYHLNPRVKHK